MSEKSYLNIYFPINNLNPQGWISEFITPIIKKTGQNRSSEAVIFYDRPNEETIKILNKAKIPDEKIKQFVDTRNKVNEDKMIFLNGGLHDILEVDAKYRDSTLTEKELKQYTLFMSTIKPYQAAFLQHYIRLQYGFRKNKNEEFKFIDLPFTQHVDTKFILSPAKNKSEGAGIVSVSTDNKLNIVTHLTSEIRISFVFSNLKYLSREINERGEEVSEEANKEKFPYGFSFMKVLENINTDKEILRLEYGRKVSRGFVEAMNSSDLKRQLGSDLDAQALADIIERKEKKVYLLNKFSNSFSFDENGFINIDVSYYNFHDTALNSINNVIVPTNINIIKENKENLEIIKKYNVLKQKIIELEEKLTSLKKEKEIAKKDKFTSEQETALIKDITDELGRTNKTFNLLKRSLKPSLTTVFLDKIKEQFQMFAINFNTNKEDKKFIINTNIFAVEPNDGTFLKIFDYSSQYDVNEYLKSPKLFNTQSDDPQDLLTRVFSRIFNSPYDATKTTKRYGNITFFPLKALFSAAYSFLSEDEKKQVPHILFGNVLMKVGEQVCSVNIGDLLIETSIFQKWYYDKIFRKDRLEYSFGAFVVDIINDLVPEVIYRNRVGFDDKAPLVAIRKIEYYLQTSPIPQNLKNKLYVSDNKDNLLTFAKFLSRNPTTDPKPLLYLTQVNNASSQITSPIFTNLGNSVFNFNEFEDSKRGIPHIKIGADGGSVLSVNFNSSDFPKIRTAFAMESLADKASRYFVFYYQLSLNMIGNNMFNYDSVICVPSSPLGIDTEKYNIGINGYYKVKSYQDSISSDNYTTSATADWVHSPKISNREKKQETPTAVSDKIILDFISSDVNKPINYITELLQNDANTIINSELQKMLSPEKTKDQEVKKDKKEDKVEVVKNVDREEFSI